MLEINHAQNGSSVEVPVGESLRVQLRENPTTGYRWQLSKPGEPALKMEEDTFEAGQGAGAGGTRRWQFQVVHTGTAPLEIVLKRSWEPQPVETFKITVVARAP
jgi:inhibitor of cysteine peptidase